jgi:NADPH:quinone reductase-like Zn-dependent oxidoreductase
MNDLSERIAKLPPEKRDLLIRRLTQQHPQQTAKEVSRSPREKKRRYVPEQDGNFHLHVSQPGILDSLALKLTSRKDPGPGQIQIRIFAASLNFRDVMIALGIYPTPPGMTAIMGSDCAGKIVATGEGVEGFHVGDEVIALSSDSFSAFTTTSTFTVVPKPACLSFDEAAAIPTVFLTVWYGLHYLARLSQSDRLLIHSAAGGVGLTAIQVARLIGAEIFATVGTPEKRDFIRSLGVEHIMNSRSLEFADEVMKLTGGEGVDVVLNSLAGEAIPKGLSILRPLGRFVELGKRDIYQNSQVGLLPFHKGLSFYAIELSPLVRQRPALFQSLFLEIMQPFEQGIFKPLPMRTFPISEVANAFKYMAQGIHIGKIVVQLEDQEVLVATDN